jgi:hypothetical protein
MEKKLSWKHIKTKYETKCFLCSEMIEPGTWIIWHPDEHISRHRYTCPNPKPRKIKEENKYVFPVTVTYKEPTMDWSELQPKKRSRVSTRALGTNPRAKGTNPRAKKNV